MEVIKKAKDNKKEKEKEEQLQKEQDEQMILEAAKKSIIQQQNLTNEDAINEIVINQEEIDKQREAFEI